MKNRVNNDSNNNSTCWYFSSACPLLLVVVFTLTASILSLQPQRVKIKSSRSSFNNNYCFNFKSCKNKEDATRTSSLFNLKAINSLHHGDEITSGGTANLEDDKDGFEWMKNVDNSNSDGSIYESIVEYDVSYSTIDCSLHTPKLFMIFVTSLFSIIAHLYLMMQQCSVPTGYKAVDSVRVRIRSIPWHRIQPTRW